MLACRAQIANWNTQVMHSELETKNAYSFYLLERGWFTQMFKKNSINDESSCCVNKDKKWYLKNSRFLSLKLLVSAYQ